MPNNKKKNKCHLAFTIKKTNEEALACQGGKYQRVLPLLQNIHLAGCILFSLLLIEFRKCWQQSGQQCVSPMWDSYVSVHPLRTQHSVLLFIVFQLKNEVISSNSLTLSRINEFLSGCYGGHKNTTIAATYILKSSAINTFKESSNSVKHGVNSLSHTFKT